MDGVAANIATQAGSAAGGVAEGGGRQCDTPVSEVPEGAF